MLNFVLYLTRPVRRGTLSRGVVRVGRERRLRPEGNVTSGLGRPKAGSGGSRKRDAPPRSARSVVRRGRSYGSYARRSGHGRCVRPAAVAKALVSVGWSAIPRSRREVR